MLGAKNKLELISRSVLTTGITLLGLSSIGNAEIPKINAIYPLSCGIATTTRTSSAKYCLNKVGGSDLEVFSVESRKNSVPQSTDYYLVTMGYDIERSSSDGRANVIVPAQRVKYLEPAQTETRDGKVFLRSVAFTQVEEEFDARGRRLDPRLEIILSEPETNVKKVRESNNGLTLKSGKNFTKEFEVEEMEGVAQYRPL